MLFLITTRIFSPQHFPFISVIIQMPLFIYFFLIIALLFFLLMISALLFWKCWQVTNFSNCNKLTKIELKVDIVWFKFLSYPHFLSLIGIVIDFKNNNGFSYLHFKRFYLFFFLLWVIFFSYRYETQGGFQNLLSYTQDISKTFWQLFIIIFIFIHFPTCEYVLWFVQIKIRNFSFMPAWDEDQQKFFV